MITISTGKKVLILISTLVIVALVCGLACAAPKADVKAKPEPAAAEKAKPAGKEKPAGAELTVEKKGSYVYWFTFKDSTGAAQTMLPQRFKGKSTDLDLKALGDGFTAAKLYVMNRNTGNLAITDYPASKTSKDVDLPADDFQYVRTVRLRVVAEDGKPIESAIVRITDGMNAKLTALVTPADEGVAMFKDVASGEVTVRVEAENLRKTIDSDIEVPADRRTPDYERKIKVAGDVNTVTVKAKPGAGETPEKPSRGLTLAGILQTIVGLFVVIMFIVILWIVLKSRGVTGKSALQGLGVELPGDQTGQMIPGAAPSQAIDPNLCQFCGQRKDANGRCSCSVVPGVGPAISPMASAPGVPRLVGSQGVYAGHIFELTSPSMVMGREASNPIALPNDTTASRRHATVSQANGGYSIRDEGSSNGTFVNGAKVTEQKLTPGDEIQVGGTKFRFEV